MEDGRDDVYALDGGEPSLEETVERLDAGTAEAHGRYDTDDGVIIADGGQEDEYDTFSGYAYGGFQFLAGAGGTIAGAHSGDNTVAGLGVILMWQGYNELRSVSDMAELYDKLQD